MPCIWSWRRPAGAHTSSGPMIRMRTPSSILMEPARFSWAFTAILTDDHSTTGMLAVTVPVGSRSTRSNHT